MVSIATVGIFIYAVTISYEPVSTARWAGAALIVVGTFLISKS
jgi:multidrug transporter EmrE-like cation transporter